MDKKSTLIGVILLCAAFYFMVNPSQRAANRTDERKLEDSSKARQEYVEKSSKPASLGNKSSAYAPESNIKEEILSLKSDTLNVHLTNRGGAIRDVELLKYRRQQDSKAPYVFNEGDKDTLAMAMAFEDAGRPLTLIRNFSLAKADDKTVVYKYIMPGKWEITREFSLASGRELYSPYTIKVSTRVKNISKETVSGEKIYLTLGSLPPTAGDIYGSNLAVGLYDGDNITFAKSSLFTKSGGWFLGLGSTEGIPDKKLDVPNSIWGTVKNQFFAAVFVPENKTGSSGFAEPILINPRAESAKMRNAIFGYMGFDMGTLEPGQTWELDGKYYVGPKDITSLASLGARQDLVMDFGWSSFVSKPLALLMGIIHSAIEPIAGSWAWGWAIVILTLIVKAVLWPLTAAQIRSSQKMLKLASGPIKEIREKYKGDQQKIGQETMKIYSEYGVNPLAGCLPALIQIPVFIGLFYMLRSSSDIRFAHFLWIDDLSQPDTISALPSIFGIPLHILPILNGIITFVQMSITPMPSTDKTQAIVFRFLPLLFLFLFYSFPSGLILYWCVQSSLGIVQALIVKTGSNKMELVKKEKKGPSFMERLQMAAENAEKAKAEGNFENMSFRERLAAVQKKAKEERQKMMDERLKGTLYEKRKKNPGGRSTKPKR